MPRRPLAVRAPTRPTSRPLAVALPLLLLLGAACSALEPEHASVVVRFREVAPVTRDRLVVTISDGDTEWYLEGTDLEASADGWLAGRALRVAPGGTLKVRIALRGVGSEPAASGQLALATPADARWRIDVFPSDVPQAAACSGCTGVVRFPILAQFRPSAQDWLYVTWTGVTTDPGAR